MLLHHGIRHAELYGQMLALGGDGEILVDRQRHFAAVRCPAMQRDPVFAGGIRHDAVIGAAFRVGTVRLQRSEEHTSELQSLMRTSYAVFCLKKKQKPAT